MIPPNQWVLVCWYVSSKNKLEKNCHFLCLAEERNTWFCSTKCLECRKCSSAPRVLECPTGLRVPKCLKYPSVLKVPRCPKYLSALSARVLMCPSRALSYLLPNCHSNDLSTRVPECPSARVPGVPWVPKSLSQSVSQSANLSICQPAL